MRHSLVSSLIENISEDVDELDHFFNYPTQYAQAQGIFLEQIDLDDLRLSRQDYNQPFMIIDSLPNMELPLAAAAAVFLASVAAAVVLTSLAASGVASTRTSLRALASNP